MSTCIRCGRVEDQRCGNCAKCWRAFNARYRPRLATKWDCYLFGTSWATPTELSSWCPFWVLEEEGREKRNAFIQS